MLERYEDVALFQNSEGDMTRHRTFCANGVQTRVVDNLSKRQEAFGGNWVRLQPCYDPEFSEYSAVKEAAGRTDTPLKTGEDLLQLKRDLHNGKVFRYPRTVKIPQTGIVELGDDGRVSVHAIPRPSEARTTIFLKWHVRQAK